MLALMFVVEVDAVQQPPNNHYRQHPKNRTTQKRGLGSSRSGFAVDAFDLVAVFLADMRDDTRIDGVVRPPFADRITLEAEEGFRFRPTLEVFLLFA